MLFSPPAEPPPSTTTGRDIDALMSTTANRPLPARGMKPLKALAFTLALSAFGVALALLLLGPLPAAIVAAG